MARARLMITAALAALTAAPLLAWHNRLTKSVPAKGDVLREAPGTIRLWFSEKPTPALSRITLLAADSSTVPTAKPRATDDSLSVAADIEAQLRPGSYRVVWRTAGDDGHAVRGSYTFTVQP